MLEPNQWVGEFQIIRLLGKGGMGEVYEAQQFTPSRRVALKVLAGWLTANEDALRRFWREAEVLAQLDHPSIVRIITTGQTAEGRAYYTMQLIRGISLSALLRRVHEHGQFPPDQQPTTTLETAQALLRKAAQDAISDPELPALAREYLKKPYPTLVRIGIQTAHALAAAHREGFLHRDIKPSNLMIDQHDQVYLMDFGLTRALEPTGTCTGPGVIVGTPWYMSPEQAHGEPIDCRADIYSLGVTLYELATLGVGPFSANRTNRDAVLRQVRAGKCLPLSTLAPTIPEQLEKVILRAMQASPSRRHATATELATALEGCLKLSTGPTLPLTRSSARNWRWWGVGLLVALGSVLLVVLVANLASKLPTEPEPGNGLHTLAESRTDLSELRLPPLPLSLQHREWHQPLALFRINHDPVWMPAVKLGGHGRYYPFANHLELQCPDSETMLLALDNDPQRRWFRFAVEMVFIPGEKKMGHKVGLFFGFSRKDLNTGKYPFFLVEADPRRTPQHPLGHATLGTSWALPAVGARGEMTGVMTPLNLPNASVPVDVVPETRWVPLEVHVQKKKITLVANQIHRTVIPWEQVEKAAPGLDPRGVLGICCRHGTAWFRRATVTALPE